MCEEYKRTDEKKEGKEKGRDKQEKMCSPSPINECRNKRDVPSSIESSFRETDHSSGGSPRTAAPRNIAERECASLRRWKAPAPDATALTLECSGVSGSACE